MQLIWFTFLFVWNCHILLVVTIHTCFEDIGPVLIYVSFKLSTRIKKQSEIQLEWIELWLVCPVKIVAFVVGKLFVPVTVTFS